MSDLIAIISIISSAIVILTSIYFNWKKLKLEEKMMWTKASLELYPELKDKAIAMGIAYSNNIPPEISPELVEKMQKATLKFQKKWIERNKKKLNK